MTRRRLPFPVALTRAALLDAARVMVAIGQWVVLDPSLCRLLGHNEQAVYDDGGRLVIIVCVRCGQAV